MAKINEIRCDVVGCKNTWAPGEAGCLELPINPRAVLNLNQNDADDEPALLEVDAYLLPVSLDLCDDCQQKLLEHLRTTVTDFLAGDLS